MQEYYSIFFFFFYQLGEVFLSFLGLHFIYETLLCKNIQFFFFFLYWESFTLSASNPLVGFQV